MKLALYARVSTRSQNQEHSVEAQLQRLTSHAEQQRWEVQQDLIYRDDGYSGATLARPGLTALRTRIATGDVHRVLITAPDRLARQYVHQVLLLEEVRGHGCEVIFLERPMSNDPHDQLLLQIRGAVAEYERSLIAERMHRGRLAKLEAGLLLPWTRPTYGYQLDPDNPRNPQGVRIEAAQAAVVREVFALYTSEKLSLVGLVKHLYQQGIPSPQGKGHWSATSLRNLLRNPAYIGKVVAGRWRTSPSKQRSSPLRPVGRSGITNVPVPEAQWLPVADIPAIIDEATFARAQAKLRENQQMAQRNTTPERYLLRALLSCGRCHLACSGRRDPDGYAYYLCRGKTSPFLAGLEKPCRSRYLPVAELDALVWQDLRELLLEPEQVTQALARALGGAWLPQELKARREGLQRAVLNLERQLERLTDAYVAGVLPLAEYQRRRETIGRQQHALEEQAASLATEVDRRAELARLAGGIEVFCERVRVELEQASFEQKRELMELLIDRVIVTDEQVEIRYVLPTSPEGERLRFCQLRKDYLSSFLRMETSVLQEQVAYSREHYGA